MVSNEKLIGQPQKPCECGCGKLANPGRRFLRGHGGGTKEARVKISKANIGRTVSDETKLKLSESHMGQKAWNHGKTHKDDERIIGPLPQETRDKLSVSLKSAHSSSDKHPGFGGKKHTVDAKSKISTSMKQYCYSKNDNIDKHKHSTKGFRVDLGCTYKSTSKANYARILKFSDIQHQYEEKSFKLYKNGRVYDEYKPDFYINKTDRHIEVNNYWTKSYLEKLEMFYFQWPDEFKKLIIVDRTEYKKLHNQLSQYIPNWEWTHSAHKKMSESVMPVKIKYALPEHQDALAVLRKVKFDFGGSNPVITSFENTISDIVGIVAGVVGKAKDVKHMYCELCGEEQYKVVSLFLKNPVDEYLFEILKGFREGVCVDPSNADDKVVFFMVCEACFYELQEMLPEHIHIPYMPSDCDEFWEFTGFDKKEYCHAESSRGELL